MALAFFQQRKKEGPSMIIYYAGTGDGANSYFPEEKLKKDGVNILMTFFNSYKKNTEKRFLMFYKARKRKLKKEKTK